MPLQCVTYLLHFAMRRIVWITLRLSLPLALSLSLSLPLSLSLSLSLSHTHTHRKRTLVITTLWMMHSTGVRSTTEGSHLRGAWVTDPWRARPETALTKESGCTRLRLRPATHRASISTPHTRLLKSHWPRVKRCFRSPLGILSFVYNKVFIDKLNAYMVNRKEFRYF